MTSILSETAFADWSVQPMSGDASSRRYARLSSPDGATAILMDASAEPPEPFAAFQRIASYLCAIGLAAPNLLWVDEQRRVLVLEDLGPLQFAQWLALHPDDEEILYSAAVDVLIHLHSNVPPPGLVVLHPAHAAAMIEPMFEWYCPGCPVSLAAQITDLLQQSLLTHAGSPDRLALRDFHAENLIWRPDRQGTDRVGLLDFQDAVLAPPGYDLVSLLRDARRDVSTDIQVKMLDRFAHATGQTTKAVTTAAAVLGVQRNLRILGIFSRLARRDGKLRYLDLIPRVLSQVQDDLTNPALKELQAALAQVLAVRVSGST